jgi:hypothetical protein
MPYFLLHLSLNDVLRAVASEDIWLETARFLHSCAVSPLLTKQDRIEHVAALRLLYL